MNVENQEVKLKFNWARFLLSAARVTQLPYDAGAEVAFIGRSNSGKSSAINLLTNQNGLAKVSKTPGRTQLINVFELDETCRIIDLPGYGYAKVPASVKRDWTILLDQYLRERECLKGLVIVMDCRRPLQEMDWQFLHWMQDSNIPAHILLTKSDKLKFGLRKTALLNTIREVKALTNVSVQLYSSLSRTGVEELEQKLLEWIYPEA